MLPGLHPGLMLSGRAIVFEGVPQTLYISTGAGPGLRPLGLSLQVMNGTAPFTFSWTMDAGPFAVSPAFGSGTSNNGYVVFETYATVEGGLGDYTLVGEGYLEVVDANGKFNSVRVPVYSGQ